MSDGVFRLETVVQHAQGLHARPAVQLVEAAMAYDSDVQLLKDDTAVDAKSVLQVLTLGAVQGTPLIVVAKGSDAEAAARAVAAVIEVSSSDVIPAESDQ